MREKPILIGMNNPLSSREGHQLYPAPEGCTGHRLWTMLHSRIPCSRAEYIGTFDRRNLVTGPVFNKELARAEAERIFANLWGSGRTVVLLGEDVRRAFGHPRLLLHPQLIGGTTWRQVPHPSGRNLWYNEKDNRDLVAILLEELHRDYHQGSQRQRPIRERDAQARH